MKFQYHYDNRPVGPIRNRWEAAAQDAVNDDMAIWVNPEEIRKTEGVSIKRIEE